MTNVPSFDVTIETVMFETMDRSIGHAHFLVFGALVVTSLTNKRQKWRETECKHCRFKEIREMTYTINGGI